MSFLASLKPLMRGSASLTVTLTAAANDALTVVIQPKLANVEPDTTDAVRAALQAALARPVCLTIPEGVDPDAELLTALTRVNEHRAPVADDLRDYLDGLAQAQQTAKLEAQKAAEKKTAASKPAPAKGKGKSATAATTPPANVESAEDEADDGDEAAATNDATPDADAASASPVPSVAPTTPIAPAPAANLFD